MCAGMYANVRVYVYMFMHYMRRCVCECVCILTQAYSGLLQTCLDPRSVQVFTNNASRLARWLRVRFVWRAESASPNGLLRECCCRGWCERGGVCGGVKVLVLCRCHGGIVISQNIFQYLQHICM